MELAEEEQEHLSALVQSSMAQIYEGSSDRSSYNSDTDGDNSARSGLFILDPDECQPGSSRVNVDERKLRELQRQALIAERESRQVQEKNLVLGRDIAMLKTENE